MQLIKISHLFVLLIKNANLITPTIINEPSRSNKLLVATVSFK